MANAKSDIYGGFWIRVVAVVIDSIILMVPIQIINSLLFSQAPGTDPAQFLSSPAFMFSMFFQLGASFLYFGPLQGALHGSPGKQLMGLRLVSTDFRPISIGRSSLRCLTSWISGFVFGLGYIWVGFSETKQGWHDKMAGTFVVRKAAMKGAAASPKSYSKAA